jgi:thiazole synthase ThiGH ThiG subunit
VQYEKTEDKVNYKWLLDKNVVNGPLIVCVAGSWRNRGSFCQPQHIAQQLVASSNSNIFVIAIPPFDMKKEELGSALELNQIFSSPDSLKSTIFLINTYHAKNSLDAFERVKFAPESLGGNRRLLVKLEVFDDNLMPDVEETIAAIHLIKGNMDCGVIPIIPSNLEIARMMIDLDISGIRVLTGDIGKGTGILDPKTFKEIVDLFKQKDIPVIAEGGMAKPDHIKQALNLGATAVLCNGCFKTCENPLVLLDELLTSAYEVIRK